MTRLDITRHILRELSAATDRAIVMVSGGKDSVVTLALAREVFEPDQLLAVYLYLVPGLRCVEAPIEALCRRLGGIELWRLPHVELCNALQLGMLRPPQFPELEEAPLIHPHEIDDVVRARAGTRWIVDGQRKMDSPHRRGLITRWGAFDPEHQRAHPLADWNDRQVWSFLHAHRLPVAPQLGCVLRSSGVSWRPDVMRAIRDRYPRDWQLFKEHYPDAEAILRRDELYGPERGHAAADE